MKAEGTVKIQIAAILALTICAAVGFSRTQNAETQGPSQVAAPNASWRPRKEVKGASFVGNKACIQCHEEISRVQHHTVMAKALSHPASCDILISRKKLMLREGPYLYQILRQGAGSLYTVSDGSMTFSEPILYCFGQGKAGQTYIFKHNGSFYESRMSFYKDINGLDYTIGYSRTPPPTLVEAAGRAISSDEVQNCFSCHATGAIAENRLTLDQMMPGVGCEACHGPGGKHVQAMKSPESTESYIFDPSRLDADELSQEFCGACHRSVDEVSHMPNLGGGINNVRFQPYRLFNSPGHNPTDARLSCSACHDAHENLSRDAASYDAKCFACHQSGLRDLKTNMQAVSREGMAKPCPKSNKLCVTCHMPQVEIPGSHFKFTDHRIRISRPGDPYPN